jgi:hypothetical protein
VIRLCAAVALLCAISTSVFAAWSNSCGPGYEKRLAQVMAWSKQICPKGMNTSKDDEDKNCDIMHYPDWIIRMGIRMRCK